MVDEHVCAVTPRRRSIYGRSSMALHFDRKKKRGEGAPSPDGGNETGGERIVGETKQEATLPHACEAKLSISLSPLPLPGR